MDGVSKTSLFLNDLMNEDASKAHGRLKDVTEELNGLDRRCKLNDGVKSTVNEILSLTQLVHANHVKSAFKRVKNLEEKYVRQIDSLILNGPSNQESSRSEYGRQNDNYDKPSSTIDVRTYSERNRNNAAVESVNLKADLEYRSKMAGQALIYNNPNIADLSDDNRPTKIAERFSELYDNEWTEAFEALNKSGIKEDKDIIALLLDIVERAYTRNHIEAERQIVEIQSHSLKLLSGDKSQKHVAPDQSLAQLVQYRKSIASLAVNRLVQTFETGELSDVFKDRRKTLPSNKEPVSKYTKKAVELTWWMCVQDPPIHMCLSSDKLSPADIPSMYKAYTRSGKNPDYYVWPALKLYKEGGLLMKGVMQFK